MRSCGRKANASDAKVDESKVEEAGVVTRNVGELSGTVELRGRIDRSAGAVSEFREKVGSLEDADEGVDVAEAGVKLVVVRLRQRHLAPGRFPRRARNR